MGDTRRRTAILQRCLLSNPAARYRDLCLDHYTWNVDRNRKARSHLRQFETLGKDVTSSPPRGHFPAGLSEQRSRWELRWLLLGLGRVG